MPIGEKLSAKKLLTKRYLCIEYLKIKTMLVSVTVESNLKYKEDVGTRMINAEFLHGAKTYASTKTKFKYPGSKKDRRESSTELVTTEAIATIRTAGNLAPTTALITLPVRDNNKGIASTERLTDFRVNDILWGKAAAKDPSNQTTVYISEGSFKTHEYLVNNTIAEIIALVTA